MQVSIFGKILAVNEKYIRKDGYCIWDKLGNRRMLVGIIDYKKGSSLGLATTPYESDSY